MKTYLQLLIILTMVTTGCSLQEDTPCPELIGTWHGDRLLMITEDSLTIQGLDLCGKQVVQNTYAYTFDGQTLRYGFTSLSLECNQLIGVFQSFRKIETRITYE